MKIYSLKWFLLSALVLACVFSDTQLAPAHGKHAGGSKETATAGTADSRDALREFVLHAKAHWEVPVPDEQILDQWRNILYELTHRGDWMYGSNYLILVDKQGRAVAHGYYESAHGKDLTVLRDARGTDVVQKLIEAAQANKQGGFVDYYWDDPKDTSDHKDSPKPAYAVNYTVNALGIELVLIGGFHHKELVWSMGEVMEKYVPEIRASSVKDKETLKSFVEKAAELVDRAYKTTRGNMDIAELLRVGSDKGAWKYNEIYLFAITNQGLVVFNGNNPNMKETFTMNAVDRNGVDVGKKVIEVAGKGGGFVYYLWDNPLVDGDEVKEFGKASGTSPKISYVKQVNLGDDTYILGSGIYPTDESQYVTDMKTESKVLRAIIIGCLAVLVLIWVVRLITGSGKRKG